MDVFAVPEAYRMWTTVVPLTFRIHTSCAIYEGTRVTYAQEFMEAFFRPLTNRMSSHPFFYLSCLYELLWKIDERYIEVPKKYRKLQPALSEILEFWYENRKISYYAKLCNISEAHFRKLFREYIGMSPVDYRNDIRLSNARNKLQSGEFSVSEAAYESGFSNLSFFTRLYKKKYGHTPGTEL